MSCKGWPESKQFFDLNWLHLCCSKNKFRKSHLFSTRFESVNHNNCPPTCRASYGNFITNSIPPALRAFAFLPWWTVLHDDSSVHITRCHSTDGRSKARFQFSSVMITSGWQNFWHTRNWWIWWIFRSTIWSSVRNNSHQLPLDLDYLKFHIQWRSFRIVYISQQEESERKN